MMTNGKRLFFAIALDSAATQHLSQWLDSCVDAKKPSTKPSNWHLTLAFLPNVLPDQQKQLVEFARSLAVSPFELHFSETGYWAHNGIFYLKPDTIPKSLCALAEPLRDKGSELGIYQNPYGFSPHITLYRNHKPSPLVNTAVKPFSLQVTHFHLYHSYRTQQQGLVYEPIVSFPL